jgi:DNA-binding NtrC family response regulator
MHKKAILLIDADADAVGVVMEAAARTGHEVRLARTSREAFQILRNEIHQLDVVIVDVDPGAHGLALLEAVSGRDEKPPMLVLTGLEETYMQSIAAGHGAANCLGKPFSIEKVKGALDQIFERTSCKQTCDRWGHVCSPPIHREANERPRFRGIATKLSPTRAMPNAKSEPSRKKSQTKRTEKLTRKGRKLSARPFPERRKTNKFRESHPHAVESL